jgi:hypothetical protein
MWSDFTILTECDGTYRISMSCFTLTTGLDPVLLTGRYSPRWFLKPQGAPSCRKYRPSSFVVAPAQGFGLCRGKLIPSSFIGSPGLTPYFSRPVGGSAAIFSTQYRYSAIVSTVF